MFEQTYKRYNYEVIIVDDGSSPDQKLTEVLKSYSFPIKLTEISLEEKGTRINPCTAYNKGFKQAEGRLVIIQNPECYHVGDLCAYVINNLTATDYFTFSCFSANSTELTKELLENTALINNADYTYRNRQVGLNWYNHLNYRPCNYHFCSAIYNDNLKVIGGFSDLFAEGYGYDDNEFLLAIKYNLRLNIQCIPVDAGFVIHQWHSRPKHNPALAKLSEKNKLLYNQMQCSHDEYTFNYPKLLHLYWDGSNFSYMNLLTLVSFNKYHLYWKINVYCPKNPIKHKSWLTQEQKSDYTGADYFAELYKISNVIVHQIDFMRLPFKHQDASEVIKSDFFRYYILNKYGGVWSDFDIMYINSLEKFYTGKSQKNMIIYRYGYVFPIGLLICNRLNSVLTMLLNVIELFYNKDNYQCLGASMFFKIFIQNHYMSTDLQIDNAKCYLPIKYNELHYLYENNSIKIKNLSDSFGVHWFNGSTESKNYQNNWKIIKTKCLMQELMAPYPEHSIPHP
jgi:hypothetical protein